MDGKNPQTSSIPLYAPKISTDFANHMFKAQEEYRVY
jgi:hypothetical protein